MPAIYKSHEDDFLKLSYGQRVRDIEHAVFTLLVLEVWKGSNDAFYKRLADLLSNKRKHPYSIFMGWLLDVDFLCHP